jgi:hypothetical protein
VKSISKNSSPKRKVLFANQRAKITEQSHRVKDDELDKSIIASTTHQRPERSHQVQDKINSSATHQRSTTHQRYETNSPTRHQHQRDEINQTHEPNNDEAELHYQGIKPKPIESELRGAKRMNSATSKKKQNKSKKSAARYIPFECFF